jgi:hypothetical protein
VTSDRIVAFDALTDDEFEGTWLDEGTILYQTVEGSEHRLFVGDVSEGHGPSRDLGVSANDWIPYTVSPDTLTTLVSLPLSDGSRDIRSVEIATGVSTPTEIGADDFSWQRLAPR